MQLLLDHGADINDGRQDLEWTPLMMAASQGQLEAMTKLLAWSDPADLNACASDDGTALTLAIACGQIDAVAHLIKNNANPNITGPGLEPPLALAASTGNQKLVKMIMDAGGYQNTTSPAYGSALAAAASSSSIDIFKTIYQVDYSLPSRQFALEQAAEVTSEEIVHYLLGSGLDLSCDTAFTKAAAKGADKILDKLWHYSRGAFSQQSKDLSLYTATDFELKSTVKMLLAMGANPDAEGEEYGNALTAAAYDGTIDIVTMLLNAGAHVRHPAGYPLQAAASQGHDEVVKLLLSRGANVNEVSSKHDCGTALHAACVSGFDDTVEILLKHSADPNLGSGTLSCPIIAATYNGNSGIVEMLVNVKVDVNVFGGPDNSTPLINAAATLPVASLKTLVQRGRAFVNQVDQDGNSALNYSASVGDDECVKYLLGFGADLSHRDSDNGTALHAAAAQGSVACCRHLLAHRASPSVLADPYHSVIQAAASSGDVKTMKVILEADPQLDVNVQGGKHGTPLHAAAMQSDTQCLKMFLEKGADANVVIGEHGTVLQTAAFAGCNKNVGILIEHGVDLNVVAGKHGTALQAAALKCATSTLQALLDAGATLEVDNGQNTPQSKKNGKYGSALAAAAARYDTEALVFLLEQAGWSTGVTGAYRQALEMAAKYNHHGSFRLIVRSEGGKAIPKKVKSKLRHEMKKRYKANDGDDNSDFGDDVVFNEQDTDDEEDYEDDEVEDDDEENEDKRVEESNPAPSAQVTHGSPDFSGQRGVGNLSGPQTSNNLGSNGHGPSSGYGPPAGYDSTPQAQFSLPPSSTSQQPNSVIDRRSIGNQQQRYSMSGHTQSYSQTSRAPDAKPQYRAYSIGSPPAPSAYQAYGSNGIDAPKSQHSYSSNGQHDYAQNRGTNINANVGGETQQRSPEPQYGAYVAPEHRQDDRSIQGNAGYNQHSYAARSGDTMAAINNPNTTASSGYNSNQHTSQIAPSGYNSNYAQHSQLNQPLASDSGNLTHRYGTQPTGAYGSHGPTNTRSSPVPPHSSYPSPGYTQPSQQQQWGFESQTQPIGGFGSQPQQSRGFEPQPQQSRDFEPQPQESRGFDPQPQRYGGLARKPVPSHSQAPVSSAGRFAAAAGAGAMAAGAGGYVLADAVGNEGDEEEEEDEHLTYDEPEEEEQEGEDEEEVEEEELAEDEEGYDGGGYGGDGGYGGGYDGSLYGDYR
jgi:ankyrin repeat protein